MIAYSERRKGTGRRFESLIHLLETQAADQPDKLVYTFLHDGEVEQPSLSYGELALRAGAVGAFLQQRDLQNQNVFSALPAQPRIYRRLLGLSLCGCGRCASVSASTQSPSRTSASNSADAKARLA